MIDVQIQEKLPSPAEYNALRSAVGWGTYDENVAAACLPRSLYGIWQGIGSIFMDKGMEYVGAHATNNTTVGLMAAKDKEAFYEQFGFVTRPHRELGSGMTLFLKNSV